MGTSKVTQTESLGLPGGCGFPFSTVSRGRRLRVEAGTWVPVVQPVLTYSASLRFRLQRPTPTQGAAWRSKGALTCQGIWQETHSPCSLSLASHLTEVWLAVAENMPFARMMLRGLMGRLQSRFTPGANAASKADIWRLAAVDPLMVSHRVRPRGPSGGSEWEP